MQKELGAKLKDVRGLREMSIRDVAEAASISAAYLQKLESGDVKSPSPHILYALSEALEVPYSTLMQLAGFVVPTGGDRTEQPNLLAYALSSEELTEDEAEALASYLSWYRHDRNKR
jgi:transcriptional regulator with XRE-family HTH domain